MQHLTDLISALPLLSAESALGDLWAWLQTQRREGDLRTMILWGVIWVGSFYSTVLLLTLWFTRRGEESVTRRAFVLAMLIHAIAGLASTTVTITPGNATARITPEATPVRRIVVEQNNTPATRLPDGNVPIWEKRDLSAELTVDRVNRELPDDAAAIPDRNSEETEPLKVELEPNAPVEAAEAIPAEQLAEVDPSDLELSEAAVPQDQITESTATSRPEATLVDRNATDRQPRSRVGQLDMAPDRTTRSGNPDDRITTIITKGPETAREIPVDVDTAVPSVAVTTEMDRNPDAANPEALVAESAGVASNADGKSPSEGTVRGVDRSNRPVRTRQPRGPDTSIATSKPKAAAEAPVREPVIAPIAPQPAESLPGTELATAVKTPSVRDNTSDRTGRRTSAVPQVYENRTRERRTRVASRLGASQESERAVELALGWFARNQSVDGRWDASELGSQRGVDPVAEAFTNPSLRADSGLEADSGITALAVLCFLGAGYTQEEGKYAENIERALRWLVRQQTDDGFLGGRSTYYARMYCHGMATIALAEAYALTQDASLRDPLERAVGFIARQQLKTDGGWRYVSQASSGDMSLFGWQLMALRSASIAGIPISAKAMDRARGFLKNSEQGTSGGLAGYFPNRVPTPAMTAEALFCRQILGSPRTDPANLEAVVFLGEHMPSRKEYNLYYYYYGTLAMHQHGGADWQRWNSSLRDALVSDQITDGPDAGSWTPRAPWGDFGGRGFSTAMSTLCLEVYYRFVPGAGQPKVEPAGTEPVQ